MAFVIAEPCIDHMDQSCVAACPVDCIAGDPSVDRKLYIDPDGCIECGACASACPNSAIFEAGELPAAWADYAWVDAAFFRDPHAARQVTEELLVGGVVMDRRHDPVGSDASRSGRGSLRKRWPSTASGDLRGSASAGTPGLPPLPRLPVSGGRTARDLTPNATLAAHLDITPDLARFRIRPDGGVTPFLPGQYVSLGLQSGTGPVLRPYSVASSPDEHEELELLIRRLERGSLTTSLWALPPGSRVWVGPPRGLFTLDVNALDAPAAAHPALLFLAAGTGLAPVMAMLGALAARPDPPQAVLIHGVARATELAHGDRIEAWTRAGWLSHRPTVSRRYERGSTGWMGAIGRVESHVASAIETHRIDPTRLRTFVCGNDGMVAACRHALDDAGVPAAAIRSESFTPPRSRVA